MQTWLKPSKCHFFRKQVEFLGHIVSEEGVATDPMKIQAMADWEIPTRVKDVRSFLGLTGYYRRFIKGYGQIAKPLHDMTMKGASLVWTQERDKAFKTLKTAMLEAPILGYPSSKKENTFILDTDASNCHIGAVLSQKQNGEEKGLSYASKVLSKSERNYCTTRRELLAVVFFVQHSRHYLLGQEFLVRTDHGVLKWLFNFKEPEGQVARWLEQLSAFNFKIEHRAGIKHGNSDGMSRRPCPEECKTCKKGEITMVREIKEETDLRREPTPRCKGRTGRARAAKTEEPEVLEDVPEEWKETLRVAQEEDAAIQCISQWTDKPLWEDIAPESAEVKYIWSRWTSLEKRDELWYYKWEHEKERTQWKVWVPKKIRPQIMMEHHDSRMASHFGVERTLARIKSSPYFWPKLRTEVEEWCSKCDTCFKIKPTNRKNKAPMKTYGVGEPMERIAVDILGPLPTSEKGNRFIIVVADYFTKWVEAYPVPNHKAQTVAEALVNNFFMRFGLPHTLHSDQGRDFESKLFQQMCQLLKIDKSRTTPWNPQSDGMVERLNRSLETMLREKVAANQLDWDEHVDISCAAYRAVPHEATKRTPNKMMLGRELPMPSHLQVPVPQEESTDCDYVKELENRLLETHEEARKHLKRNRQYAKKEYDKTAQVTQYEVNQWVWLFNPIRKKGRSPKLQIGWEEKHTGYSK